MHSRRRLCPSYYYYSMVALVTVFDNCCCCRYAVETGRRLQFDAFVCYTSADASFVNEMIYNLENIHGLQLFITERNMVAGGANFVMLAELIKSRYLLDRPFCERSILCFAHVSFLLFFSQLTFLDVCKPTFSKLFHMTWLYSKKKRCCADFLKVPPNKN